MGVQTADPEWASMKEMPDLTILLRWGVGMPSLSFSSATESMPMSSAKMTTMLGCFA